VAKAGWVAAGVDIAKAMISNERPSPFGNRPRAQNPSPRPPVNETTLKTDKLQIERKTFVFTLRENPRGRFLRITEDVSGRRDTIIIPAPGLEDFRKMLEAMEKASADLPPTPQG
jgi:hypothetical protein